MGICASATDATTSKIDQAVSARLRGAVAGAAAAAPTRRLVRHPSIERPAPAAASLLGPPQPPQAQWQDQRSLTVWRHGTGGAFPRPGARRGSAAADATRLLPAPAQPLLRPYSHRAPPPSAPLTALQAAVHPCLPFPASAHPAGPALSPQMMTSGRQEEEKIKVRPRRRWAALPSAPPRLKRPIMPPAMISPDFFASGAVSRPTLALSAPGARDCLFPLAASAVRQRSTPCPPSGALLPGLQAINLLYPTSHCGG